MNRQSVLLTVCLIMLGTLTPPAYGTVISINDSGQIEVQDNPNYLQKQKLDVAKTSITPQNTINENEAPSLIVVPTALVKDKTDHARQSDPIIARIITPAELQAEKEASNKAISEIEEPDIVVDIEFFDAKQETELKPATAVPQVTATKLEKPKLFASLIELEAAKYETIDIALIEAVIEAESNYNPVAISPKGAMGLMQLMPATATSYGVIDAFNPAENIKAGTAELARLMEVYDNNLALALAGYNAGEAAVEKYDGIPPYNETQNYVVKILSKILNKQAAVLKSKTPEKTEVVNTVEEDKIRPMKVYTFNF